MLGLVFSVLLIKFICYNLFERLVETKGEETMEITYYGHSCVALALDNGVKLLIDPFLSANPLTQVDLATLHPDYILATHGHFDHIADLVVLAQANDSTVICIAEMSNWLAAKKIKTHAMNIGGAFHFPFGTVKMVAALHGSSFIEDGQQIYLGLAAGFILQVEGKTLYHAGDTAYFSDMRLLAEDFQIDLAFLPIGDNFTMGLADATRCVTAIAAKHVVPIHYNTFPQIEQNPELFRKKFAEGRVLVMSPDTTRQF